MARSMAMKSVIGLVLLLTILSHSLGDSVLEKEVLGDVIEELEKEVKDFSKLAADVEDEVTVDAFGANEKNLETYEVMNDDDERETPNLFKVNVIAHLHSHGVDKLQGGDELLTPQQVKIEKADNDPNIARDAIKNAAALWPKTGDRVKVPYVLDPAIQGSTRKMRAIRGAIAKYKELTCIDWVPANTRNHYVKIISGGGCYSYIGRVTRVRNYKGFQPLSIGNGCGNIGTVEHEMLHALGFFHEQSRPDRDNFVKILLQNLVSQRFAGNFKKQRAALVESAGEPYDIGSVMHYGSNYFAKRGKYTILRKSDGLPFRPNRKGFSKIDLLQINAIYKCGKTSNPRPTPGPTPGPGVNPGPGPGPGVAADPKMCEGLAKLGLCGYNMVCNACKQQCQSRRGAGIISDVKGTVKCSRWKRGGYCTHRRLARWMSKYCMKTCFEAVYPRQKTACQ